ncbi:MAG: ABC transporter substrate-binding protein [Promethearchaeota archaeon]
MNEKKIPKKKRFLPTHKPIVVGGLVAIVSLAGIITGVVWYINRLKPGEQTLIWGVGEAPLWEIDPLELWWPVPLVENSAEGLFAVNLTNPESDILPNLALDGIWSLDGLNFTCPLRQKVKFHDDTPFNAIAAKWNFDRVHRLSDALTYPELWKLPDGRFIINETIVIDDYTIRFVLNAPYAPFKNLLSAWPSYILSPTSTPDDEFLNPNTEFLVGTGPFIYDHLEVNVSFSMSANQDYWGGRPQIDTINFTVIPEEMTGIEPFLLKKIHLGRLVLNQTELKKLQDDPSFNVTEHLVPRVRWLVLNNKLINTTMRKALSYAVNCSTINEFFGDTILAKSPIPENVLYHNITGINIPYYNVTIARQILKDAGWPGTENLTANGDVSPENEWETVANSSTPLATYNYTIFDFWEAADVNHTGAVLVENFKQIGVKIELVSVSYDIMNWMECDLYGYHRNMYHMTFTGWIADINDPSNFINAHFTTEKLAYFENYNYGQVNDTLVQQWMEEALTPGNRRQLYYQIQKHLIEEVYPNIWLHSTSYYVVTVSNLEGYYPNWFRPYYCRFVYFKSQ